MPTTTDSVPAWRASEPLPGLPSRPVVDVTTKGTQGTELLLRLQSSRRIADDLHPAACRSLDRRLRERIADVPRDTATDEQLAAAKTALQLAHKRRAETLTMQRACEARVRMMSDDPSKINHVASAMCEISMHAETLRACDHVIGELRKTHDRLEEKIAKRDYEIERAALLEVARDIERNEAKALRELLVDAGDALDRLAQLTVEREELSRRLTMADSWKGGKP